MTLSHNELRGNTNEMLQEVTNNVRIEPILQLLTGEEQSLGGEISMEARAGISARGFWCRGQRAVFNARIFDPNAYRHENKTLKRCYKLNEHEKKRDNISRILNVEQGSFTLLVFSIADSMGREFLMFAKRMCQTISLKRKEELSVVNYRSKCKINYALSRSSLLCVRGSGKMSREYVQLNTVTFNVIKLAKKKMKLNCKS